MVIFTFSWWSLRQIKYLEPLVKSTNFRNECRKFRSTDKIGGHKYMVLLCIVFVSLIYILYTVYIYISVGHVCFHQTHSPPLSTLSLYQALLPKRCGLESQIWVFNPFITLLVATQAASETTQKVIIVRFLYGEIPSSMRYMFQVFPHDMVQLHTNFLEYNLVIFWLVGMPFKTKHWIGWIGGDWGCWCFTQVSNDPIDTRVVETAWRFWGPIPQSMYPQRRCRRISQPDREAMGCLSVRLLSNLCVGWMKVLKCHLLYLFMACS